MWKLSELRDNQWVEHVYGNVWELVEEDNDRRIVVGPRASKVELLMNLSRALPGPFGVLYVLKVPRTKLSAGRYQMPAPIEKNQLESFLMAHRTFFEADARHHIWIHCVSSGSTMVYDNHDVIYLYGPIEKYVEILNQSGLVRGTVRFPAPHAHNYHSEFDTAEAELIEKSEWKFSPLRNEDDS